MKPVKRNPRPYFFVMIHTQTTNWRQFQELFTFFPLTDIFIKRHIKELNTSYPFCVLNKLIQHYTDEKNIYINT